MTSLYSFVELYARALETVDHLLGRGAAFAAEKGISEQELLGWRLADDMNPLSFQLAVAINFCNGWVARGAGLAIPEAIEGAAQDVANFKAAIAAARAFLDSVTPQQINDRDGALITFKIGDIMEPTLPAHRWLTGFATTNIHFHMSIAYAILRMKGVPIGKIDLFPSGL